MKVNLKNYAARKAAGGVTMNRNGSNVMVRANKYDPLTGAELEQEIIILSREDLLDAKNAAADRIAELNLEIDRAQARFEKERRNAERQIAEILEIQPGIDEAIQDFDTIHRPAAPLASAAKTEKPETTK